MILFMSWKECFVLMGSFVIRLRVLRFRLEFRIRVCLEKLSDEVLKLIFFMFMCMWL